jgi:peptidoglycan hydrolase-like protein with peptidoglycan-binding domain
MPLARKIGSAGIVSSLLMIGMLVQGFPRSAADSDSNKEGITAFVAKNEVSRMQETLHDKGHYHGKADGFFGLRTRASIRAYQKAENLPVTGQVDARTAAGLGVRPESTWGNSESVGTGVNSAGDEIKRDKPSAGIRRSVKARKTARKEVLRAVAAEDIREDVVARKPENEKHNR